MLHASLAVCELCACCALGSLQCTTHTALFGSEQFQWALLVGYPNTILHTIAIQPYLLYLVWSLAVFWAVMLWCVEQYRVHGLLGSKLILVSTGSRSCFRQRGIVQQQPKLAMRWQVSEKVTLVAGSAIVCCAWQALCQKVVRCLAEGRVVSTASDGVYCVLRESSCSRDAVV